jgi:hypothetical protein
MEPIDPTQGRIIHINNLKNLSSVLSKVISDHSLAKRITAIEIDETKGEDLDADGDPIEFAPEAYEKYGAGVAQLIETVYEPGRLDTFQWITGNSEKISRPLVFWDSLWRTAAGLKHLDIDFTVHELAKLAQLRVSSYRIQILVVLMKRTRIHQLSSSRS